MGLCLYLHPSPDEGSMVIFINVAIGQGQFRHPFLCCSTNKLGTSAWTPGNPSRVKSLANPKMAPLVRITSSLLPYPPFLHLNYPIPQALLNPPLLPSLYPSTLTSTPTPPHAPKFAWQSCLLPISRRINIYFSLGSPYSASQGSRTIGPVFFVYG